MPTFQTKSEVNGSRIISRRYKDLGPKIRWNFRYTVVIAPGGAIVYRHSGAVDAGNLLAKLIEKLSPYYTRRVD